MDPPKNFSERVKEEDLSSDGENNKTNPVTTDTHEAQLNVTPAANASLSLVPETTGGGNASVRTIPFPPIYGLASVMT